MRLLILSCMEKRRGSTGFLARSLPPERPSQAMKAKPGEEMAGVRTEPVFSQIALLARCSSEGYSSCLQGFWFGRGSLIGPMESLNCPTLTPHELNPMTRLLPAELTAGLPGTEARVILAAEANADLKCIRILVIKNPIGPILG